MSTITAWADILNPLLSVLAMLALGIYTKRESNRRQRSDALAEDVALLRTRSHDLINQMQRLPTTLAAQFVERREWEQAERSADHIHATMNDRLGALEARR